MRSSAPNDFCYDRRYVVDRHMEARTAHERDASSLLFQMYRSAMPPMANSAMPRVQLCQSNAVTLKEITNRGVYVHEGRYVLIRTIVPSCKMNSVQSVVDDPDGDVAVSLLLYNYHQSSLPVGVVAVLMNPYFKATRAGYLAFRCDNPNAHFQILGSEHQLLMNVTWKAVLPFPSEVALDDGDFNKAGVRYFKENNFPKALELFSKALEDQRVSENHQRHVRLYINRSATLLALGSCGKALEDAEMGLKLDAGNVKLLTRKASALIQLGQFEDCIRFLESGQNKLGSDMLVRANRALSESRNGDFDFRKLVEESRKALQLDGHGDFLAGDLIEVRQVPGFGRGLVAKQDIPAGKLLIGEKALAFANDEPTTSDGPLSLICEFDPIQNTVGFNRAGLLRSLVHRLPFDIQLRKAVYDLCAGPDFQPATLAQIESEVVDIERVKAVLKVNSFSTDYQPKSSGLWRLASYINHICIDENVTRFFIGDFIFICTSREIKKDQQLLLTYCPRLADFSKRDRNLRASRGFVCECRLCQMDRNDPVDVQKRMVAICNRAMKLEDQDFREMERLLSEARLLRPCFELNQSAVVIATGLARMYEIRGDYNKAIQLFEETASAMEAAGLVEMALTNYIGMFNTIPGHNSHKRRWQQKIDRLVHLFPGNLELWNDLQILGR